MIDGDVDELNFCELYTITATNGDVLRFTDWDADLVVGGNTYLGSGLIIPKRGGTKGAVGFAVDETTLDFLVGESDDPTAATPILLNGLTLQQLTTAGFLDKAEVLITRLFWPTPGVVPSWAPIHKFGGTISKPTENTRNLVAFDVQSHMQKLNRPVPQTIMQPSCPFFHYGDERCGVVKTAYDVACVVAAGTLSILLKAAALGTNQADSYFDKGLVTWTSGKNKGLSMSIKKSTQVDGIFLDAPMIFTPQIGDAFIAAPGCSRKDDATGCVKFSNSAKFGGYKFVPAPESAI